MASIRENFENRERNFISPHGCLSSKSRGRIRQEDSCPIRTAFQRDRNRIVYSNAFRRLKHKTQVFLAPLGLGDHYRTRLTHTLEVAEIARTICRAIRLNEDLAEAISLGHDLGHTPFGHGGETVLKEIYSREFSHQQQSLRVVDLLENNGRGLNLTLEVRNGIEKHSKGYGKVMPKNPDRLADTMEGRIVRIADIMAYLNHDLDDAIRSGVIHAGEVPTICLENLGRTHSQRATRMINDLIDCSETNGEDLNLIMSDTIYGAMTTLRKFLYTHVYRSPKVHREFVKAKKILSDLFHFYMEKESLLFQELADLEMDQCHSADEPRARVVCDFIASMTDRQALALFERHFFPAPITKGG
ncbi:MAG: deoxyguanosinetriphosphate triphosphohydrolase [Deltaproteobacteria bacterium]|nr:deoxyguanosinetriphosphate triphosphohydrolase [Deltaproteobacteria bacterium]